ncbi:MAG: helix-turn-helix domain-containing protein [Planctomycetota bacterium]
MARKKRTPVDQRVAARLRSLREAQGLSQAETARRAGIARSHLSQIESGVVVPSIVTADGLATALGITFAQLVEEEPEKSAPDPADAIARRLRERGPAWVKAVKSYLATLDEIAGADGKG